MKMWPAVHRCPWPQCAAYVEPDLWGCKQHWFAIPPTLRRRLWQAYRKGQTIATASDDYREAAADVDAWIQQFTQTGTRPPTPAKQGDLPL